MKRIWCALVDDFFLSFGRNVGMNVPVWSSNFEKVPRRSSMPDIDNSRARAFRAFDRRSRMQQQFFAFVNRRKLLAIKHTKLKIDDQHRGLGAGW